MSERSGRQENLGLKGGLVEFVRGRIVGCVFKVLQCLTSVRNEKTS